MLQVSTAVAISSNNWHIYHMASISDPPCLHSEQLAAKWGLVSKIAPAKSIARAAPTATAAQLPPAEDEYDSEYENELEQLRQEKAEVPPPSFCEECPPPFPPFPRNCHLQPTLYDQHPHRIDKQSPKRVYAPLYVRTEDQLAFHGVAVQRERVLLQVSHFFVGTLQPL